MDLGTVPPGLDVREPVVSAGPGDGLRARFRGPGRRRGARAGPHRPVRASTSTRPSTWCPSTRGARSSSGSTSSRAPCGSRSRSGASSSTRDPAREPGGRRARRRRGRDHLGRRSQPALVTVEGEADALAGLVSIDTPPVSVSGATADVEATVGLDLPEGVAALGVEQVRVTITIRPRHGHPDLRGRHPGRQRRARTWTTGRRSTACSSPSAARSRRSTPSTRPGSPPRRRRRAGRRDHAAVPVTARLPAGVTLVSASPPEVTVTVTAVATRHRRPRRRRPSRPATPSPSPTPAP